MQLFTEIYQQNIKRYLSVRKKKVWWGEFRHVEIPEQTCLFRVDATRGFVQRVIGNDASRSARNQVLLTLKPNIHSITLWFM